MTPIPQTGKPSYPPGIEPTPYSTVIVEKGLFYGIDVVIEDNVGNLKFVGCIRSEIKVTLGHVRFVWYNYKASLPLMKDTNYSEIGLIYYKTLRPFILKYLQYYILFLSHLSLLSYLNLQSSMLLNSVV